MTADSGAELFVAEIHPQFGEYLAEQHASGYDADSGRDRFRAWLGEHAKTAGAADPVREYLRQISKVPGLSAEQEAELGRQIEAGRQADAKLTAEGARLSPGERIDLEWLAEVGARARNRLLEANLRLVVSLANRYAGRGVLFLDLIQEGNLGLIQAIEHFDHTKGYKFSTYATWWIRQAITRALASQPGVRRLPDPGAGPGP